MLVSGMRRTILNHSLSHIKRSSSQFYLSINLPSCVTCPPAHLRECVTILQRWGKLRRMWLEPSYETEDRQIAVDWREDSEKTSLRSPTVNLSRGGKSKRTPCGLPRVPRVCLFAFAFWQEPWLQISDAS